MNEITLELTNKCNNNCLYCSSKANRGISTHLKLDYIKNILNKYKPKQVNLSGGEPLLYPKLFELINWLNKYNYIINIYTSGNLKNDYESIKIFKRLKNKVNKVVFNFNINCPSLFNFITQSKDSYYYTLSSIYNAQDNNIKTQVNIVPMIINFYTLEDTIENIFTILKIKKVNILKLVNQGNCTNYKNIDLNYDKDYIFINTIYRLKEKYGDKIRLGNPFNLSEHCTAEKEKLVVMSNGEIIPCEAYKDGVCKCERIDKLK